MPLLVAFVGLVAVTSVAIVDIAARLGARNRAAAAADAAALAGVGGGAPAAARLAAANGARLVSFRHDHRGVIVVVEVDGERATAAATDGP